jgi:toxin YoeB
LKVLFTEDAWADYTRWAEDDRRMLRRTNVLIRAIQRGDDGIGRPELLRHDLTGFASRRINEEHRLVYRVRDNVLEIASCRYHYSR